MRALTKRLISLAGMFYGAVALAAVGVLTDATGTVRTDGTFQLAAVAVIQQQNEQKQLLMLNSASHTPERCNRDEDEDEDDDDKKKKKRGSPC